MTGHSALMNVIVLSPDTVDLLFVIDNSGSMADKQPWLARAVVELVERLVNPPCVDYERDRQYFPTDPRARCEYGERPIVPLRDLHLGFITTSLGGHGHDSYCESPTSPRGNDRAHLLPTVRKTKVETYDGKGFLAWDDRFEALRDRRGIRDIQVLRESIETIVQSAGTDGCGLAAPLEAWYRFLIDPAPPERVVVRDGHSTREGVDQVLLDQRAAFLRPDSDVIIVMIADGNDCSVRDDGPAWKLGNDWVAPGTTACATDPKDPCCFSCEAAAGAVPDGCLRPDADPACLGEWIEAPNVVCVDQKRRFGVDLRYPTSRYVSALHSTEVCPNSTFADGDCTCQRAHELGAACDPGEPVPNPLFVDSRPIVDWGRDSWQVTLVGIVGVPWQDLATPATLYADGELELCPTHDLDWSLILGSPGSRGEPAVPPEDALMVESVVPRLDGQAHPLTGVAPAPPDSRPQQNPINGHEWSPMNGEELQYACIFGLGPLLGGAERDCNALNDPVCDCFDPSKDFMADSNRKRPVCQQRDGSYSSVQVAAKAYPGLRELEVLRDLEGQSIVASICPKVFDADSPDHLYRPAFDQLARASQVDFTYEPVSDADGVHVGCLATEFPVDSDTGQAPCVVVEAMREDHCLAECDLMPGRRALDNPRLEAAVRKSVALNRRCTAEPGKRCPKYCLCEIMQLEGQAKNAPLWQCQHLEQGVDPDLFGFCYVSPARSIGDESLVSGCYNQPTPSGLRFLGEQTPRGDAVTFMACTSD